MIQANELRLGNWVTAFPDRLKQVDYLDIRDIAENRLIKPYTAIPLTPEILEKCGFGIFWEYQIPLVSKGNFHMHWTDCLSANFGHIDQLDVECKYLHQLQNLYFALTGQELLVNL